MKGKTHLSQDGFSLALAQAEVRPVTGLLETK